MKNSVLFMMDNAGHKGGAHFATLSNIRLLHKSGFGITVFSGRHVDDGLKKVYPFVTFITPRELKSNDPQSILELINTFDIVCVPFEDSGFRKVASMSGAYKIQWIHIDYRVWKDATPYARDCTKDDREIYSRFDKIVFASKIAQAGFKELYPELGDKTQVCYNLLDADRIKTLADLPADGYPDAEDIFNIITVTRMSNLQKGITRTLEVIERLKDDGYAFEWLFVGDGVDFDALQRYSVALDLDSHLRWLGYTDNPYCLVKNADLFALFSHYEVGTPLAIYESLLVGTPVISTCYMTSESYTPFDTGWCIENNEDAIYNGLMHLLDNRDLVSTARSKLENYEYDIKECEQRILEVFFEAAERQID